MKPTLFLAIVLLANGCGRTAMAPGDDDTAREVGLDTGGDDTSGPDTVDTATDTAADADDATHDTVPPDAAPDAPPDTDAGPTCPDPNAPHVDYVSQDPMVCAVIDFDCTDGWSGFDAGECGCGCRLPDDQCDPTRFSGTSGMAEPFDLGASCEFLIACSTRELPSGRLPPFLEWFPDARCGNGTTFGCPDGTASFCEAYVDVLDPAEVIAGCALSLVPDIGNLLCGGDM